MIAVATIRSLPTVIAVSFIQKRPRMGVGAFYLKRTKAPPRGGLHSGGEGGIQLARFAISVPTSRSAAASVDKIAGSDFGRTKCARRAAGTTPAVNRVRSPHLHSAGKRNGPRKGAHFIFWRWTESCAEDAIGPSGPICALEHERS